MKKKKRKNYKIFKWLIIILIIVAIGYFAYRQISRWWYEESQIAVKVGDDIITYREINNRILLTVGIENIDNPVYEEQYLTIKKQVTDEIVKDSLVMKYAKEKGYEVKEEELNNEDYVGNDKYRVYFVELIRKEIENEIKNNLSDEELLKYFNDNKSDFVLIKAQIIYIKSEANDTERKVKEAKINEAYNKLLRGYSFTSLVKEYSDIKDNDGISDYFDIYKYNAIINEVIFDLKIGEVSKPISTIDGFYIFKIIDRIDDFESFKDKVKEKYINVEANKRLAQLKDKLMEENQEIIIYGNRVEKIINWYNTVFLGKEEGG
ncbi:MAG: peptidyl-prolyl cis-trans isomerase [Caldisericia bacterium]|nr:peptidyl-prolyl cis-trans isomerase [Caldisericia bacterium]